MREWEHLAMVAICIILVATILTLLIRRFCPKKATEVVAIDTIAANRFQDGIAKLQQRNRNYSVFRRGISPRPLFSWSDHPTLITDAVENGWSRFGFTGSIPSPSSRPSLLGLCAAAGDYGEGNTEITWDISQGSADFMQKIRVNNGLKMINVSNYPFSVIRTALPLPGPPLGNSAFPQEAYFEITILCSEGDDDCDDGIKEGEKIKLIQENSNRKLNSESVNHIGKIEELAVGVEDERVAVCLGLSTGGSLPLKFPGSYPGSIGFNSNGSVYLDGIKVSDKGSSEWAKRNKVIGCGYDPRQKKVFFTVNAELVQAINCKSEEFGSPLYPTIAANTDITFLVNFGQSSFDYAAANAQRTPNPCFIGPMSSSALGYEDSKELFSMGRIDSQWLTRNATKSKTKDFDEDCEADFFEIVLEGNSLSSKSPRTQ